MREIKFRAWYIPREEMVQPDRLESINFDTKVLGVYMPIENKGFHRFRMSDFILMQYTGLKDRNGVDIYEGDIVSYTSNEKVGERKVMQRRGYDTYAVYGEVEIRGVVKFGTINRPFEKGLLYYVDTDKSVSYDTYFWGSGKKSDRPEMKSSNLTKSLKTNVDYQVIGNVYENLELLEDK